MRERHGHTGTDRQTKQLEGIERGWGEGGLLNLKRAWGGGGQKCGRSEREGGGSERDSQGKTEGSGGDA